MVSSHSEFRSKIEEVMWVRDSEHWVRVLTELMQGRHREDHDAANAIVGAFTINAVPYFALIGNSFTYSYVSCVMAEKLGILVEETASDVTILSPLGQSTHINKIDRRCPLQLQGEVFLTELIELPFRDFDLILGMDWLSEHRAILDCKTKQVTLRNSFGNEIIMVGERQNYLTIVIFALVMEKLNIRVVKKFPNIFPEELPGLPLEREVELGIGLLLGTIPMSIALYRMALKKLKELKAQIQKLLDRGFIKPSMSLWRVLVLF
ncbi:uncharacterized protein [Gossypium hirsutum]|uniref:Uncharacterized protein n=1 Tax=Gossypium hirsutum TaxID=3635 RepID=A0A1U8IET0_GOSHI|nr:uncharacterized protein LOC107921711 [Gossypium hirsutum]